MTSCCTALLFSFLLLIHHSFAQTKPVDLVNPNWATKELPPSE